MCTSDVIAIIAIVVSFANVIFQLIWEKFQNSREKRVALYKEVYKEIFFDLLPIAKLEIQYNNNRLTGMKSLEDLLRDIRRKSYFFEYVDPKFKTEIFELEQEFEDFLLGLEDKELTNEDYRKKYSELEEYVNAMYALVLPKMK